MWQWDRATPLVDGKEQIIFADDVNNKSLVVETKKKYALWGDYCLLKVASECYNEKKKLFGNTLGIESADEFF